MTLEIYRINVPDDSLTSSESNSQHRQSTTEVLGGGRRVERLTGSPGDVALRAQFRGRLAPVMAREAKELLEGADNPLPISRAGEDAAINGYYSPSDDVEAPLDPRADGLHRVRSGLSRAGSRNTHWLVAASAPSQPNPGHEFGNAETALVGIPADAKRVRAVDSPSQPTGRSAPSPVATVQARHGAVDLYEATAEPFDDPSYLYDLAYDTQGDVDPGVWDTYGGAGMRDDDGVVQWGRVFDPGHDFGEAEAVLENGLLRLTIDEPTNADATAALDAETYDAGADSWSTVDLPSYQDGGLDTDWRPVDVDLTHIGQARIAAQVEFEAVAGTNAGDVYSVDVELERGRESLEVWAPESVAELPPPDLEALLEPIASTSVLDSGVEQGLVAREEVRL